MFISSRVNRLRTALLSAVLPGALVLGVSALSTTAHACGGFFCELTPIDQAGEQIIFRHQGTEMTALVRILYSGDADSFSWVVPVPNEPEVSLGDDAAFVDLDVATRPQFELERRGESCGFDSINASAESGGGGSPGTSAGGVDVLQDFTLGGFEVEVVQSNDGNPEAMATWLVDNGYTLSDRGRDLLQPYVDAGMVFVALKLRSGASTGTIQPLVMKYQTEKPMIPIRLTAVAAQDDMGIQTWIVADARAVPENYLHVKPNYTRLNWFAGQRNAYASYQSLITDAMNEVSAGGDNQAGQGFATDYAGPISQDILDGLSLSIDRESTLTAQLAQLDALDSTADFIANALNVDDANPNRLLALQTAMPLPDGLDSETYRNATSLGENFTAEQLQTGKDALRAAIVDTELEALRTTLALLPRDAYMTRLYTTLSADEMGVDPVFAYNTDMPQQPLTRKALLDQSCTDEGTKWTLTLGEGTEREGEVVISANLEVPFGAPAVVAESVDAAFIQEATSGGAGPQLISRAKPGTLELAADGSVSQNTVVMVAADDDDDDGFLGLGGPWLLGALGVLLALRRRTV